MRVKHFRNCKSSLTSTVHIAYGLLDARLVGEETFGLFNHSSQYATWTLTMLTNLTIHHLLWQVFAATTKWSNCYWSLGQGWREIPLPVKGEQM